MLTLTTGAVPAIREMTHQPGDDKALDAEISGGQIGFRAEDQVA